MNDTPFGDNPAERLQTSETQIAQYWEQFLRLKQFERLFETSMDPIFILNRNGAFIEINSAGIEMLGYAKEEIIGLNIQKIYSDPTDHEKFLKAIEPQGYVREYEVNFRKKDGTSVECLMASTLWRNEDGTVSGYQGTIRDITSQKFLMTQLCRLQKMEAIGALTGGIAHNFNNLLMTIQGNISLILMKTGPGHPHYQKLKTIEGYIQHGSELGQQLLGLARGTEGRITTVNLNHLIQISVKMFAATRKEISINIACQEMLWPIEADPLQMEQVMLNLFVNACQSMPEGGELFIRTENFFLEAQDAALFQVEPGRYIKITVTDTGCGMDETTKQKAFEPFFTARGHGCQTSLFLSTVYGIIKNHQGHVTVLSQPGKGTTFYLYLPTPTDEPVKETKEAAPLMKGRETILIIDDEKMVIDVASEMLAELGYNVLTSDNGTKAIGIFRSRKDEIDLVILDLIMPKMGGEETFSRLKWIDPAVNVLLSSGYDQDGKASDLLQKGCRGFIQKPYNLMELSKKIREIISSTHR